MSASVLLVGLQGAFTHQDFAGHKGTIRAGDVQVSSLSSALSLSPPLIQYLLKNPIHGFNLAKHK